MNAKHQTKRILGVDPGTNILGFAIIDCKKQQLKLVEMGVINLKSLGEQQFKLKRIFEDLQFLISKHQPDEMAIEAPFYGKNPQSMLKLGRAQGVAIAAAMVRGLEITEYMPKKIKLAVTGNGNASKEQVAAMLSSLLRADMSGQYLDATDALATAVCHHFKSENRLKTGKQYGGWGAFLKDNPDKIAKPGK